MSIDPGADFSTPSDPYQDKQRDLDALCTERKKGSHVSWEIKQRRES
jgi:hypothetical protein